MKITQFLSKLVPDYQIKPFLTKSSLGHFILVLKSVPDGWRQTLILVEDFSCGNITADPFSSILKLNVGVLQTPWSRSLAQPGTPSPT